MARRSRFESPAYIKALGSVAYHIANTMRGEVNQDYYSAYGRRLVKPKSAVEKIKNGDLTNEGYFVQEWNSLVKRLAEDGAKIACLEADDFAKFKARIQEIGEVDPFTPKIDDFDLECANGAAAFDIGTE